jgi:hypothetical protein
VASESSCSEEMGGTDARISKGLVSVRSYVGPGLERGTPGVWRVPANRLPVYERANPKRVSFIKVW